jgi:hypothetical protein
MEVRLPGKPITDQQWRLYMRERQRHNQAIAAARAGMSERTARRHEKDPRKPSERRPTRGRTVPDPLEGVWEAELVPMLETDSSLKPVTLLHCASIIAVPAPESASLHSKRVEFANHLAGLDEFI